MAIAFPFVEVSIDTKGLQPEVQRAPGVLAIVGGTNNKGSASNNDPIVVNSLDDAAPLFNEMSGPNIVAKSALYSALEIAFLQNPRPSKIYAVKASAIAAGLTALEAVDDVTFVAVADKPVKSGSGGKTAVAALKAHVENQSAAGNKRIGVAAIDPEIAVSASYGADTVALATSLKATTPRMVMVAARGAVNGDGDSADVAAAAASAIAGQAPASSMVLKKIFGLTMPLSTQFKPGEITALSDDGIIPIIDPALVAGESLHFAEGTLYTTDASQKYIDLVRLLDDVEFRLRAGLIGLIGDARITRTGLAAVIRKAEGILGVVKSTGAITGYSFNIPAYNALLKPEAARSATETQVIFTARSERLVDMTVTIVIGPAIHRLKIALQPKF
ncbi:hypothetical protein L0664_15880 [Octadecabacter sp. G9-8]|uniref:Phage tail protein n=1 Tax=Octadecabacter dasysiphoniae TaxID=2909341 RepID=A0ABS9CZ54_9RHOB|nr:hypothetical protein [Octadecabacter dasysiphoniae]MCF2872556.1 hypothetical protein [Octadecabacter dasysiphoniae]